MDGSQPRKGIDPHVIHDHGAETAALGQRIRDIESEALRLQDRLALERPMPKSDHRPWWRRSA
jgi:hypothetical protein